MFHYFTIKFRFSFFASFRFKFFASPHLSNFRFEAKQSEAKFKSIFSLFFAFFTFFGFFWLFHLFFSYFSLNFRFASIFSLNFRLFYLRFRFRFLVFRIEVNHVKSGFFFTSKRSEIFASNSNFASEAKVGAHPRQTVVPRRLSLCVDALTLSSPYTEITCHSLRWNLNSISFKI